MYTLKHTVHATTAMFPGQSFAAALAAVEAGLSEDFGSISLAHAQLCPQNFGVLDSAAARSLRERFPQTAFRLHANCRLLEEGLRIYDAATGGGEAMAYFARVGAISRELGADVYSIHAGERRNANLAGMAANVRAIEDVSGLRVAVEGLYPAAGDKNLVSTWGEYRWLLDSGMCFAVDLSHLNIVRFRERRCDRGFVAELLASERCLEVHLSANGGDSDDHAVMRDLAPPWWADLLHHINSEAVVFSEGNAARKPMAQARVMEKIRRAELFESKKGRVE